MARRRDWERPTELQMARWAYRELVEALRFNDLNAANKYMSRVVYHARIAPRGQKQGARRLKERGIRAIANFWRRLK